MIRHELSIDDIESVFLAMNWKTRNTRHFDR